MMPALTPGWSHLLISLAGIGAAAGLAAVGTISGSDAVAIIGPIVGVGLGVSGSAIAAAGASTPSSSSNGVPGAQ